MIKSIFPVALAAICAASAAHGQQSYPVRPIHVIVPYSPGGVVDVQARVVTQRMAATIGQPMVVEAKPGASGNIAATHVAQAQPDGYTLLVSAPYLSNNPLLEDTLRWAPRDLVPVGRFSLAHSYLVVPASSPAKTLKDYVVMAKQASAPLQYGGGGGGSTQDVTIELFKTAANIELDVVGYKGAPPMVPDLISGALSMAVLPSSVAYPHLKSGALRALANTSSARSAQFPDVPTIAEAGYPQATSLSWYGLHAPAGTPPEIIRTLEDALRQATAAPDVKTRLSSAGGESAYMNQADFAAFIQADAAHSQNAVKAIRARLDQAKRP